MVRLAEAPLCEDLRVPGGIVAPECVCSPGTFCLSRQEMETATAAVESDAACRVALADLRDKPPLTIESGWQTWEVVLLVVGVGVGAALAGYGLSELVDATN